VYIVNACGVLLDRRDHVVTKTRCVADIDAKADPRIQGLDVVPSDRGRRVNFILRTVVMNREFLIEFLRQLLDKRQRCNVRLAHHRLHARGFHILEGLAAFRFVRSQIHHAGSGKCEAGGLEFLRNGEAIVHGRSFPVTVQTKERDVRNPHRLHCGDRFVERHVAHGVRSDAETQPIFAAIRRSGRIGYRGGRGFVGFRRLRATSSVGRKRRVQQRKRNGAKHGSFQRFATSEVI
jgi:hypothetical protein